MKTGNKESLRTKYKSLFIRTKNLVITPKKEWNNIYEENSDINSILSGYILPYIGVLALVSFISHLNLHSDSDKYITALKQALAMFSALFFGLYITYYITKQIMPKFTVNSNEKDLNIYAFKLIAYSSVILYLIQLIVAFIPELFFFQALSLYTGYIVWKGSEYIGRFESNEQRITFSAIVGILLLFVPYFLFKLIVEFSGLSSW